MLHMLSLSFEIYFKILYYNLRLKQKIFCVKGMDGNKTVGRKFDIGEANIHCWRNNYNSIYLQSNDQLLCET